MYSNSYMFINGRGKRVMILSVLGLGCQHCCAAVFLYEIYSDLTASSWLTRWSRGPCLLCCVGIRRDSRCQGNDSNGKRTPEFLTAKYPPLPAKPCPWQEGRKGAKTGSPKPIARVQWNFTPRLSLTSISRKRRSIQSARWCKPHVLCDP